MSDVGMNNEAFFIAAQTDVVPLAIAEPGTCKTRSAEAYAKAMDYDVFVGISLSHYEPTDIGGYPAPRNDKGDYVKMVLPEFIHDCIRAKSALLFIDELTTCSPATQAAALRIMTHGLGDHVKICAAANPPECAANGYPLTAPMSNRLYHHNWSNRFQDWSNGLMQDFPERPYPVLKENWKESIHQAKVFVLSFLNKFQKHFHHMPEKESDQSKPWPSARSWTNACNLLGAGISLGYDFSIDSKKVHPVQAEFLSGTVGAGVSEEFFKWKNSFDLPDPEDLLKKPSEFELPKRNDIQMVLLGSLTSAVLSNPTDSRFESYWALMNAAFKAGAGGNVVFATAPIRQNKNEELCDRALRKLPKDLKSMLIKVTQKVLSK